MQKQPREISPKYLRNNTEVVRFLKIFLTGWTPLLKLPFFENLSQKVIFFLKIKTICKLIIIPDIRVFQRTAHEE